MRRRRRRNWVQQCRDNVKLWEVTVAGLDGWRRERAERVLACARQILAESEANPEWGNEGSPQARNARLIAESMARRGA